MNLMPDRALAAALIAHTAFIAAAADIGVSDTGAHRASALMRLEYAKHGSWDSVYRGGVLSDPEVAQTIDRLAELLGSGGYEWYNVVVLVLAQARYASCPAPPLDPAVLEPLRQRAAQVQVRTRKCRGRDDVDRSIDQWLATDSACVLLSFARKQGRLSKFFTYVRDLDPGVAESLESWSRLAQLALGRPRPAPLSIPGQTGPAGPRACG
jgi:hypothetical protein